MDGFEWTRNADGILVPSTGVTHRNEDYDELGFEALAQMQRSHFWYRGRHRFLLAALRKWTRRIYGNGKRLSGVDLGAGCGGWISLLERAQPDLFAELALADSSLEALRHARSMVSEKVTLHQVDLANLMWRDRWQVVFLLDVLEHLPDDAGALREIYRAVEPGGLLFLTAPAFSRFWSYNDELAHHQRRYCKSDFRRLADETGWQLCDVRYFMFFLSPLLLASRFQHPVCQVLRVDPANHVGPLLPASRFRHQTLKLMSRSERADLSRRIHRVPTSLLNFALARVFCAETPLGLHVPFPFGTSILAVLRKPKSPDP